MFIEKMQNLENINNTYEYIKLVIFGIASLYLIYLLFYSLFKKVWINRLEINDLVKIIIDKNDDETKIDEDSKIEVTLFKNNGRKKKIDLQKNKNQLTSFLEEMKKKNSRLKIEFIKEKRSIHRAFFFNSFKYFAIKIKSFLTIKTII